MDCCGFDTEFNEKSAQRELAAYRKTGPKASTQLLINYLKQQNISGQSLLDIGGGVGAIQFELMQQGINQVNNVDAAIAYQRAARQEAEQRGVINRIKFVKGDFVALSSEVDEADIVTLDKVICCYENMPELVQRSVRKAKKYYAIIIPRDKWWVKWVHGMEQTFRKFKGDPFRSFIHPVHEIEQLIGQADFRKAYQRTKVHWLIQVYEKE